jgi:hypothetical protein
MGISTHSMIYLRKQPVRKRLAARRVAAGLAIANSREHNNAEGLPHERSECFGYDRFLAGPKGASQIDQCRVAYSAYFWCSPCKGHAIPCGLPSSKAPTFGSLADLGRSAS